MQTLTKEKIAKSIQILSLYGIVVTIVFSKLNLNSLFIITLLTGWLIEGDLKRKFRNLATNRIFFAYLAYFIIHVIALAYSKNLQGSLKHLESKLGYLILPLILCSTKLITIRLQKRILWVFCIALTFVAIVCLTIAAYAYSQTNMSQVFFYHDLLIPFGHHAVYFSAFILIGICFICVQYNVTNIPRLKILIIIWLTFLLSVVFLLSSKLMILLTLGFFVFYLAISRKVKIPKATRYFAAFLIFLLVVLTASTDNFIKRRFTNLLEADLSVLTTERFNPGVGFTGLDFRLLLWRVTYEIIDENNAYLNGIGTDAPQNYLIEKYRNLDMYQGDGSKDNIGFLAYNCHNQLLQTSLQSGLIGLVVLIAWFYQLGRGSASSKNLTARLLFLTILLFCFTESVFERQYGMILTTFLPLILLRKTTEERIQ